MRLKCLSIPQACLQDIYTSGGIWDVQSLRWDPPNWPILPDGSIHAGGSVYFMYNKMTILFYPLQGERHSRRRAPTGPIHPHGYFMYLILWHNCPDLHASHEPSSCTRGHTEFWPPCLIHPLIIYAAQHGFAMPHTFWSVMVPQWTTWQIFGWIPRSFIHDLVATPDSQSIQRR